MIRDIEEVSERNANSWKKLDPLVIDASIGQWQVP